MNTDEGEMLKLDFIEGGSDDAPLIRIWGADPEATIALRSAFESLARGERESVVLDQLAGVESAGGCRVTARDSTWDRGVVAADEPASFVWLLTNGGWWDVVGLLEPFCEQDGPGGFQWLSRQGDIGVLISRDGLW